MGELETTVAAPFVHMRLASLPQMKLIFYYTQDKRWMGLDPAKKLIAAAEASGLVVRNAAGEFELRADLRDEKIPLGFRPTDAIFSVPLPEKKDVIEEILSAASAASGLETRVLVAEMQEIRKHFDNLIADDAACAVLAKKYHVDLAPFQKDLIARIESE